MRKDLKQNVTCGRNGIRAAAALSFTLTLALFGCTTNKTAGDGQPTSSPDVGPPNLSATPGSSSGSHIPPQAMYSSSSEAIAVLAADQAYSGQVLGPLSPARPTSSVSTQPGEQIIAPALTMDPELMIESSPPPLFSLAGDPASVPSAGIASAGTVASPVARAMAGGSIATASITPVAMTRATVAPGVGATAISGGTQASTGTGTANGASGIAGGTAASNMAASGMAGGTVPALVAPQASTAATMSGVTPSPTSANVAGPGVAPSASSNVTAIPTIVPGSTTNKGSESAGTTVSAGITMERPLPAGAATANGATNTMIAPASASRVHAVRPAGGMSAQTAIPARTVRPGGSTPEPVKSPQTGRTRVVEPPAAPTRTRPIRVTTASDGTVVVTNAPKQQ